MTRKGFLAAAAGAAATLATSAAALAQTQTAPPRNEVSSARSIRRVRGMLESLIDQLQRDQHDYGGFRVRAVEEMRRARDDLDRALQWDATHPR